VAGRWTAGWAQRSPARRVPCRFDECSATSGPFARSASGSYDAVLLTRCGPGTYRRIQRFPIVPALVGAAFILAMPAFAQSQQEWALCQDLRSPELPIQGCTAVIEAGRQVLDRLAAAYNNRGVAYRLKTEYDKAIGDFDEAIKLRPNYPNAFNNRPAPQLSRERRPA
jgi:tetratricopeptide (TPR) repeat protein